MGGPPAHDQPAKGGGGEMRGRRGTERGLEQMFSHTCWKRDGPLLPQEPPRVSVACSVDGEESPGVTQVNQEDRSDW